MPTWRQIALISLAVCCCCGGTMSSPQDGGVPDAGLADAGHDAGVDAGADAGSDAGVDAGSDAGFDAGVDAGVDAGSDAGGSNADAGIDGGNDAGLDPDGGADGGLAANDGGSIFSVEELALLNSMSPPELPPPPADVTNAYADSPQAAALGQRLFFDTLFSGALLEGDDDGSVTTLGVKGQTGRVACAGCHIPASGFLDTRSLGEQISLAAGWGIRRTPSLLDVGQARLLMWDGRNDAPFNQVFGPLEASNEMNSSRLFVAEQIGARYSAEYTALFGALPPLGDPQQFPQLDALHTGCSALPGDVATPVCHGMPGDGAEYDGLSASQQAAVTRVVVNAGKALGAYLRLLSCGQSRFDSFMHGDPAALSSDEQLGAQLFVSKGRCITCHAGPYLSDQQFHNAGLFPSTVAVVFLDANDRGAGLGWSKLLANPLNSQSVYSDGYDGRLPPMPGAAQEGAFRTPPLRCMMRRPSFMHTGQMSTVEEVVSFFNQGGNQFGYLGTNELAPLGLTASEQAELAAFLETLEGPGPAANLLSAPQ